MSESARAHVKYLRISPRKVRLVTRAIQWKPALTALGILTSLNKKAARLVEKGLKSALANAKVKGLDEARLVVSEAKADEGPSFKRFMTRSMGRADQIMKRTAHITITLKEGEKVFDSTSSPASSGEKTKKEKPGKSQGARPQGKKKREMAGAK